MTDSILTTMRPPQAEAPHQVIWPLACIVFAASLGWFLVGTSDMALIDRDEPMIAEVARQMVHRNEWLTPHLPAWEEKSIFKPPLAMWVMAASFKMLGVSEMAARLPSVICSSLTVTILFAFAARRWGRSPALVAASCMALPLLPAVAGRLALTDPLMTLLATIVLLCLDKSLRIGGCRGCNLAMWIIVGAAMLIKGPAILAFFGPAVVMAADRFRWKPYLLFAAGMLVATLGGSLLLNDQQVPGMILGIIGGLIVAGSLLRWLVPVLRLPIGTMWGAPLMFATAGWWFLYISQSGGAVHQASAKRFILFEVLTRIAQPMEYHSGPPGYYLIIAMVGLLPLSTLLPRLLVWSFRNRRSDPTLLLLLAWVVGSWMLCEISSTKLPHYILPAWPALSLLASMWWKNASEVHAATDRKRALGIIAPAIIFAGTIGTVAFFAWQDRARIWLGDLLSTEDSEIWPRIAYLAKMEPWQVYSLLVVPILLLTATAAAWLLANRRSVRAGVIALSAGWAPALLMLVAAVMSRTPFSDSLSRQAAMQALALGQPASRYLAIGYTEPALFFYLPAGQYQRIESARHIQSLPGMDDPFVLITSRELEPGVREWLGNRITDMRVVSGINSARGQPGTACVFAISRAERSASPTSRVGTSPHSSTHPDQPGIIHPEHEREAASANPSGAQ